MKLISGSRRVSSGEVSEASGMGSGGNSTAIHAIQEASIPDHFAPANGQQCDESVVCGVADGALVLGGDVVVVEEYSSQVEGKLSDKLKGIEDLVCELKINWFPFPVLHLSKVL